VQSAAARENEPSVQQIKRTLERVGALHVQTSYYIDVLVSAKVRKKSDAVSAHSLMNWPIKGIPVKNTSLRPPLLEMPPVGTACPYICGE